MDIEKYLEGLPDDLKEKARACKSVDELVLLAKDSKVPIPSEALKAIAGGGESSEIGDCSYHPTCPKCGSDNTYYEYSFDTGIDIYRCSNCREEFRA